MANYSASVTYRDRQKRKANERFTNMAAIDMNSAIIQVKRELKQRLKYEPDEMVDICYLQIEEVD